MGANSSGSSNRLRMRFSQPDDVFQVKVSLVGVEPPIWRMVLVPQNVRLPRLHHIVQAVMGWTDSHLHQFLVGEIRFGEPGNEFEPSPIDYRAIHLNQIAPRPGATCIYEYDFGDSWEHLIEVQDALPIESVKGILPRCLDGERACPPEDVGGPHGYANFLLALEDPSHPEHEEWRQWAADNFDPVAFDVGRVNSLLARYAPRRPRPQARGGSSRRS